MGLILRCVLLGVGLLIIHSRHPSSRLRLPCFGWIKLHFRLTFKIRAFPLNSLTFKIHWLSRFSHFLKNFSATTQQQYSTGSFFSL